MSISSFQAAKTMCDISDWSLTNLKLQKLLYLAHMVSLGRKGQPLVNEFFAAWMYGPVLPSVYDRVKVFGAGIVDDRFYNDVVLPKEDENYQLLQEIYNFFGQKNGWELVKITHLPKGAWSKNYTPSYKAIIPNNDILAEYNAKIARQ